jgi:phosphoglycolate phosphatase-like HAD superfamily hydrolase
MAKITVIILDFDGVILESVSVKTDAFRSLFAFVPHHVDAIVRFHLNNGGMSRFDKFDHIYKNILNEPLTHEKRRELSEKFSSLIFEKMLAVPFVPGAKECIEKIYPRIPLYVVSATPENELAVIAEKRELTHFFKRLYGSPRKKSDCIRRIITECGVPPSTVIFIGDAKNDLDAAFETGVTFIGRVRPGDHDQFAGCRGVERIVKDLKDLPAYIEDNS